MDSEFQPDPIPDPVTQVPPAQFTAGHEAGIEPFASQSLDQASGLALPVTETAPIQPDGNPIAVSDQFWKVDPRSVSAERISGLIFSSVLLAAAVVGLAILWFGQGEFNTLWIAIAVSVALILAALFVYTISWPWLSYQKASWRLDEEGLEIRRGVLWRHRITVPLGRVQHADVSQGPLQRQFGIGTLTVHTAGTQHASIPLEGLTYETAIELRDLIVVQKKDQHVV